MPQINTELGLPTKEGGVRKKQEPLSPLSAAKVLAHVFLLTSAVFLEMFHVTLFTYPLRHICFLSTYWLNCFHLLQKKLVTCGGTTAFLLMSPACKLRAAYHWNSVCCPFSQLSLFHSP